MTYLVLARKYRPLRFAEVVGQEHVAGTLRNAVATGRVGHAYLFSGPRGVGKTSMARILGKALNCPHAQDGEPCGECSTCLGIASGNDLDVIEIDGASNRRVEEARNLRENVRYAPSHSPFKVYIIDETHMLTSEAFNTLLKSLEEPPPHVKFILATTEPRKLPDTIVSRCQRFDFAPLGDAEIAGWLAKICEWEKLEADPEVLLQVARKARGGMRDALSDLDQLLAIGQGGITQQAFGLAFGLAPEEEIEALVDAIAGADPGRALDALEACLCAGRDLEGVLDQLACNLRDALVLAACGDDSPLVELGGAARDRLADRARRLGLDRLAAVLAIIEDAAVRAERLERPRLAVELALVRAARIAELIDLASLLERLRSGEAAAPGGSGRAAPAGGSRPAPTARPAPYSAKREAAPPAVAGGAGTESAAGVEDRWSRVLDQLRKTSPALARVLANARPQGLKDGQLLLKLGELGPLERSLAENPRTRESLIPPVEAAFGAGVRAVLELPERKDEEPAAQQAPAQDARKNLLEDDRVQSLANRFKGKVVRNDW